MAHVAIPDNNGCIRLDDLESMLAVHWSGHCDVLGRVEQVSWVWW